VGERRLVSSLSFEALVSNDGNDLGLVALYQHGSIDMKSIIRCILPGARKQANERV